MTAPRRPAKNPNRVPRFSQEHDPVGREPGGAAGVVVIHEGETAVPKIERTGTYWDKDGNSFFFRAGHVLAEGQGFELVEAADRNAGAPERRQEGAEVVDTRVERAEKRGKPAGKGE